MEWLLVFLGLSAALIAIACFTEDVDLDDDETDDYI